MVVCPQGHGPEPLVTYPGTYDHYGGLLVLARRHHARPRTDATAPGAPRQATGPLLRPPPPPGQPASAPGPSTWPPRGSSRTRTPPPTGSAPANWNAAAPTTSSSEWCKTAR